MKKYTFLFLIIIFIFNLHAQSYTSYFTGNTTDLITTPQGGTCLMGGATESDEAMVWFLNRSTGGDVLVLRASGSDGYNNYFYNQLGVNINSVETIVCHNANCANETYIHQKIQQAEAIWFAGGDQWDYISYWRNTKIQDLINDGIQNRNIVIGGTSAGMAIQGGIYFSAENSTVTSSEMLNNPYNINATIDNTPFIQNAYLEQVITDTHYDNPDRKGRHAAFIARIQKDWQHEAFGIACEEYTAVCIDENGIARVFGEHPTYDDFAYFLQYNCELNNLEPEVCTPNTPLSWNGNQNAIKVYKVAGTVSGSNTFDLNEWKTGTGGEWQHWWMDNGTFNESTGTAPTDCTTNTPSITLEADCVTVHPNATDAEFVIKGLIGNYTIQIVDVNGVLYQNLTSTSDTIQINIDTLPNGIYFLSIANNSNAQLCVQKILKY